MNRDEQRDLGIKLATDLGAEKTLAALNKDDFCYEDILKTAASELGLDKFVATILKNDPTWAAKALSFVPDLGDYRESLIKKVAEHPHSSLEVFRTAGDLGSHEELLQSSAGALVSTQGEISGFHLLDQGGYNCAFTMYWTNNGNYPVTRPPANDGPWSEKILLGQSTSKKCSDFATAKSPLAPGNEVWMYMWVQAGTDNESPLHFTYNPNTANYAYFTSSGTTTSNNLGFNKIAPLK